MSLLSCLVDLSASSSVSFGVSFKSLLHGLEPQLVLPVDAPQRGCAVVHLCELQVHRVDPAPQRVLMAAAELRFQRMIHVPCSS